MKFLTLSLRDVQGDVYRQITAPHILISITQPEELVSIPKSPYKKDQLNLCFHDVSIDCDRKYIHFDKDMAQQILHFVEKNIPHISLIVTHCHAGVSRSVAVNAALSKIINHVDDNIFSRGIPNILVYTTLLDCYFLTKNRSEVWKNISYLRNNAVRAINDLPLSRLNSFEK